MKAGARRNSVRKDETHVSIGPRAREEKEQFFQLFGHISKLVVAHFDQI
jgi:hypothetical protein